MQNKKIALLCLMLIIVMPVLSMESRFISKVTVDEMRTIMRNCNDQQYLIRQLHHAARYGRDDIVQVLLEGGVPVDSLEYGSTALGEACLCRRYAVIRVLLNAGASMTYNGKNKYLINAAASGQERLVRILLWEGADPDMPHGEGGVTALGMAAWWGHENIVRLLMSLGADIDVKDEKGTALGKAAAKGHIGIMRLLLGAGANCQLTDKYGDTPLQAADGTAKEMLEQWQAGKLDIKNEIVDRYLENPWLSDENKELGYVMPPGVGEENEPHGAVGIVEMDGDE